MAHVLSVRLAVSRVLLGGLLITILRRPGELSVNRACTQAFRSKGPPASGVGSFGRRGDGAVHRRQLIKPHLALENIRRWRHVLADALAQNLAIGLRAAVADHLGRAPTRAELTAARRAAHSLAALGRARVLHMPGAADADAGDRTYLVLAKPNVIMSDIRLQGLTVTHE